MFYRQCRDTFIRKYDSIGYITSQLTRKDRVYDEIGRVFLDQISRQPVNLDHAVNNLAGIFIDVNPDVLKVDFTEFINDIQKDGYVVVADHMEQLDTHEPHFSYNTDNPKTIVTHILNNDLNHHARSSEDFLTDYFREHSTIFGAHFEITTRCNERCVHCYQTRNTAVDIEISLLQDIMDQLCDMGTVSFAISGGEPMSHPRFPDIIRMARMHDFSINILSNGALLNDDILSALVEANINMMQVSLYSMNHEIHDEITRIPGSHAKTVANILRLIEHDIPLQISCPIMKINAESYSDVFCWCRDHKIRVLSDFIMMAKSDFDTDNLRQRLSVAATQKLIDDMLKIDAGYQLQLETEPKTKDLSAYANKPICGIAVDNVCFTANGFMYPCSGFQGYLLGDASKQKVRNIWEHGERVNYLRSITNASFPKCLTCGARDYCIMCLVRNFNESNGDMFKTADHFCEVAFMNKEIVDRYRSEKTKTGLV